MRCEKCNGNFGNCECSVITADLHAGDLVMLNLQYAQVEHPSSNERLFKHAKNEIFEIDHIGKGEFGNDNYLGLKDCKGCQGERGTGAKCSGHWFIKNNGKIYFIKVGHKK
jgi:hypothetical protein